VGNEELVNDGQLLVGPQIDNHLYKLSKRLDTCFLLGFDANSVASEKSGANITKRPSFEVCAFTPLTLTLALISIHLGLANNHFLVNLIEGPDW